MGWRGTIRSIGAAVRAAERILAGDKAAMLEFLQALDPLGSVATLGESLRLSVPTPKSVSVTLDVLSPNVGMRPLKNV